MEKPTIQINIHQLIGTIVITDKENLNKVNEIVHENLIQTVKSAVYEFENITSTNNSDKNNSDKI